jgi:site-specific DNA-adenine methylase
MNEQVSAWLGVVEDLPEFHKRIKYVEIRKMEALDFIKKYDSEDAFFYLDPPYLPSTRTAGGYEHELSESGHETLLDTLSSIEGRFLIHGYPSDMYDDFARDNSLSHLEISVKKHSSSGKVKPEALEKVWGNYDFKGLNK